MADPVAMVFDPDGRMWVAEMLGYMPDVDGKGEEAPVGRIVVLEDANGDGKMDKSTVFLDKLVLPRSLCLVAGGLLVAEPPALLFCRDTDGDLKCDEKTVVVPNYCSVRVIEHTANGLVPAIDNWIYNAASGLRLRRAGGEWILGSTRLRGQWGVTQDDIGRLFYNDNSQLLRGDLVPCWSPRAHLAREPATNVQLIRDQTVWPARPNTGVNRGYRQGQLREDGTLAVCTAACWPAIYRGDNFPDEFRGNAFICEPAGNLVKRLILSGETARNAYEKAEFLTSTDERFRPVAASTGPDGCLYVVDLYRGILQHKLYVTSFLRKEILSRGLEKPVGLGRIYRVVSDAKPAGPPPRLAHAKTAELVKHLSHPNGWRRDTAQRLIVERGDLSVVPALKDLLASAPSEITKLHALFALEGLRQIDAAALESASGPRVREAATVLKENPGLLGPIEALLKAATADPNVPDEKLAGKELDFLEKIMANEEWEKEAPGRSALLSRVAARVVHSEKPADVAELLDLAAGQSVAARWRQRSMLEGMHGLRVRLPARSAAFIKLLFAEDDLVRDLARDISTSITWPGQKEEPAPPRAAPLTAEERARFDRGKRQFAASCAACHQLSGRGEDGRAPALVDSEWTLGSTERLARIILNGLNGPLVVNGKSYYGLEMPAVLNMSTDEIAEVLTYIRREWGHQASPVDVGAVRKVKAAVENRDEPWTAEELLKIP